MGALLILLLFIQPGALLFLYFHDKELKLLSKLDIKQVKMLTLPTHYRSFFVYYRRKEGLITKHAYIWMIAYYIVNGVGFVTLFIQLIYEFIIESDLYSILTAAGTIDTNPALGYTCCILAVSNGILFVAAQLKRELGLDQKQVLLSYRIKERKNREEEKRKRSPEIGKKG